MELWTPDEKLRYIYAFMRFSGTDISLDFWQDDYIKNKSRFIALLKSRQTGFSFSVALKGLAKAMDPARLKYTKQFVSYNEDDAQEKIRYAKEFYDSIPKRYKKRLIRANNTLLEFEDVTGGGTSRLISLPCRPPRGKNGDVCLDEFAIYPPRLAKNIYTAAGFCTLRRGCIEIGSTPLGTIGRFYEICTDRKNYPNFDRYFIPWWYAQVMCRDVRRAVVEAKDMPTEERVLTFGTDRLIDIYRNSTLEDFQQECECSFVDSSESYISLELIYDNTPGMRDDDIPDSVSDDDYYEAMRDIEVKAFSDPDELILRYDPEIHGDILYMGMDIGRYHDATAFYILGKTHDGKRRSVFGMELKNTKFDDQKKVFRKLMHELPIYRAMIDRTGMGTQLAEEMGEEFGDRAEGIPFTFENKAILAMDVKLRMERKEFLLENSRSFHHQIHSIKRIPAPGGGFRYDSDRTEEGHADKFWAFALASHAMGNNCNVSSCFYTEYHRKKTETMIKSEEGEISNNTVSGLTSIRRGKSLESVLRRVRHVR